MLANSNDMIPKTSCQPKLTPLRPFHVRLAEYNLRRDEIFSAPPKIVSRSARRMKNFWAKKKRLRRFTISSIVYQTSDIRPYIQIDIKGEPVLALLDSGANKRVIGGQLAKIILEQNSTSPTCSGYVKTADDNK